MLTKDVSNELEQAIQTMHAQGKQPTVALVRAQLTSSIPMPAIIAAIKNWKGNKPIPKIEIADNQDLGSEKRIAQLEEQVQQLKERVTALEAKL